jgi:signal transduction histidine kinase
VEVAFETIGGDVVAALGSQPDMAVALLREQANGTYVRDPSPLAAVPRGSFHIVHTDADSSTVWIGGAFGVARYDASAAHERPPLRTHLRTVHVADSLLGADPDRKPLATALPASTHRLRFEVSVPAAPGLPPPRYSFRLQGFETEWSSPSPSAQREYTNLAPGRYTLQARAELADGRTSTPVAYAFTVAAPWYRTAWAFAGYLVLFAGLVAGATRYVSHLRLRRQVKALEAERRLQDERQRISRDLHDHVGAQLSNIKSGLELVRLAAAAGAPVQARRHLHSLDEDVDLTISQLRDTIWALHGTTITAAALGHQVKRFLDRQTRYRERPQVTWTLDPTLDATLSPTQGLHVFRIIQETVANALKHADASTLEVHFLAGDDGALEIVVRDDGVGLPCAPEDVADGYGLANVRARAEAMGAAVRIEPTTPSGTTVRLTVPV